MFAFTIDDPSARDLDDAISFTIGENLMTLCVHITNVALAIPTDSELFKEAFSRVETIYGKEVVNMIPDRLATDELSLIVGQSRNVITVSIPYHRDGDRWIKGRASFTKDMITVNKRLSYEEADLPENRHLMEGLIIAWQTWLREGALFGRLEDCATRSFRIIDDKPEMKLNEEWSRNWISVAMKIANIEVARQIGMMNIDRRPGDDKQFRILTRAAGVSGTFKQIYDAIRDKPYALIPISQKDPRRNRGTVVIGKAVDCQVGDMYTKFTSPIRRFHDLVVQHILNASIDGEPCPFTLTELQTFADKINSFKYPRDDSAKEAYLSERKCFDGVVVSGHTIYIKVFIPELNMVVNTRGNKRYGEYIKMWYADNHWLQ